jgi:asparagine synthase (glutamine-hydrolysing)
MGPVGLGHTRLKVIDLKGGQQPRVDHEAGKALVFNGEIYNYRQLQSAGFQSRSDTETLFHLLRFDTNDWIHDLHGMFAFAGWDNSSQELLLVRDRVGIKPLYYTFAGGQFLFASEIKSLLLNPLVKRAINSAAVPEYLCYRSIPEPETIFAGIFALQPGHCLRISTTKPEPTISQWWSGGYDDYAAGLLELAGTPEEQFEAALGQAIDYRLISDVPVGTFNSGGIDSSLITALVSTRKSGDLHTFSVGFNNSDYDETPYANIVADKFKTSHHRLVLDRDEYSNLLADTVWFNDTPVTQPHTPLLLAISRLAKEFVTVVLTGEGADETWAGYPRFQIPLLANYLNWLSDPVKQVMLAGSRGLKLRRISKLLDSATSFADAVVQANRFVDRDTMLSLDLPANPDSYRRRVRDNVLGLNLTPLETLLAYDRQVYMVPLLHRLDRTSMATGLEARVPFLDHRLISWGMRLPPELKMKLGRDNKVLLKRVAKKYFPREMIYRRKKGFDVPLKEWFREPGRLRDQLDLILSRAFLERGFVDRAGVRKLVNQHLTGSHDRSEILWSLLNFELWTQMFITGDLHSPNAIFNKPPQQIA